MKTIFPCIAAIVSTCAFHPALSSDLPQRGQAAADAGFWIAPEYLAWSATGDRLPALATSSPAGTPRAQAGVLSAPETVILAGDATVNDGRTSGGRVRFGYRLDPARRTGLEASYFRMGDSSAGFDARSTGAPILAQPFLNAGTGRQDALLIAYPGVSSGQVAIRQQSRPSGASLAFRGEVCGTCRGGRIDGLIGYRFLGLTDRLDIARKQLAQDALLAGFAFESSDRFHTRNRFHGLDLGLTGDVAGGPWTLTWAAKIALGYSFGETRIHGQTAITPPGGPESTVPGGLLAQPSNMGDFSARRFAMAPELSANLAYRIGPRLRLFAGYTFTGLNRVVRPGDAIDTTVNLDQPGVPSRPRRLSGTSDYWLRGANLGLAFEF